MKKSLVLTNAQLQELIEKGENRPKLNLRLLRQTRFIKYFRSHKATYLTTIKHVKLTSYKHTSPTYFAGFGIGEAIAMAGLAATIYGITVTRKTTDSPRCKKIIKGKICNAFLLKTEFVIDGEKRFMNSWCEKKHVTKRLLPNI